jgi:hypothetical protein
MWGAVKNRTVVAAWRNLKSAVADKLARGREHGSGVAAAPWDGGADGDRLFQQLSPAFLPVRRIQTHRQECLCHLPSCIGIYSMVAATE